MFMARDIEDQNAKKYYQTTCRLLIIGTVWHLFSNLEIKRPKAFFGIFYHWKKIIENKNFKKFLKFPIEIFRRQFEIRTFIFLNTLDYGTLINKEIEPISISTLFVEIQLDIVLEVLLMVGLIFFSTKLVDRYHGKIHWKN